MGNKTRIVIAGAHDVSSWASIGSESKKSPWDSKKSKQCKVNVVGMYVDQIFKKEKIKMNLFEIGLEV